MSALTLAVFLLGQAAPAAAPGAEIRALTVTLLDEKDREVTDVSLADVALSENGVSRDIASFKPDTRPLSVAIVVDTSAAVGSSYRLNVVDAVLGLVTRLPDGARYALWTTGDRPTKVLDHTDDREAAANALKRVAPQGGNYVLDAVSEASADLKKLAREGDRTVVVVVTGTGPEFSYRDKYRAADEAEKNADLFLSVQVDSGEADFEVRSNISYVLDRLARATGGRYDVDPLGDGHGRRPAEAVRPPAVRVPPRLRHPARHQEAQARPERRAPRDQALPPDHLGAGRLPRRALSQGRDAMNTRNKLVLFAVTLAATLAAAAPPLGAQARPPARPQAPIFGTGIEIINLSLSVTDPANNFVTDLAQRDFAVFEDGIRQELSLFTHENLPISLVLMVDTSASMEEKIQTAQAAAIRFTKTLRSQDLAQIVQFNDRATTLQPFTNDLAALEAAIRKTETSGRPPSTTPSTSPSRT